MTSTVKPQFCKDGKHGDNLYSELHRTWGSDMIYIDVDGIEWVNAGYGKFIPGIVIEECRRWASIEKILATKDFQLQRSRQIAEALSVYFKYKVEVFLVIWDTIKFINGDGNKQAYINAEKVTLIDIRDYEHRRDVTMDRWLEINKKTRDTALRNYRASLD